VGNPAPNWGTATEPTSIAVLYCCKSARPLGLGFRIILLTCGAKGTRTPGLLHAMEPRPVHSGSRVFTGDPVGLRVRSCQSAVVHRRSPRTVTNLVTSRPATSSSASNTSAINGIPGNGMPGFAHGGPTAGSIPGWSQPPGRSQPHGARRSGIQTAATARPAGGLPAPQATAWCPRGPSHSVADAHNWQLRGTRYGQGGRNRAQIPRLRAVHTHDRLPHRPRTPGGVPAHPASRAAGEGKAGARR
jgi:hypothetical protein